jgi:hypothetical protein
MLKIQGRMEIKTKIFGFIFTCYKISMAQNPQKFKKKIQKNFLPFLGQKNFSAAVNTRDYHPKKNLGCTWY